MRYSLLLLCLTGLLASCASAPKFDVSHIDNSLAPQKIVAEPAAYQGKKVLWGGIILDTRNLADSTQIEVLGYPLDRDQLPLSNKNPMGRFLIQNKGFLDPVNYSQGRKLTVLGQVGENQQGKVGDSVYTYPVIHAEQIQLWTKKDESKTRFHFGFGIML